MSSWLLSIKLIIIYYHHLPKKPFPPDTVCNNIVHLYSKNLHHYKGDYDVFERTRADRITNLKKEYETQKTFREHMQVFIDKFRYSANRAAQVQSKIKMLNKLPKLVPIIDDPPIQFKFRDPDEADGFAVQLDDVSFKYNEESPLLFEKICCGVDFKDRICLVGENGAGKTTLLNIMLGKLKETEGTRNHNRRCRIGYFAQHHIDSLGDLRQTPLEWIRGKFPDATEDAMRSILASFGIVSDIAKNRTLKMLSGGQKSRVAFAALAYERPNLLVLDEPTNHLDIETVEALGEALMKFKGGCLLVSHDDRLIRKTCATMWCAKNKKVNVLKGGVDEYLEILKKEFFDSGIRL